MEKKWKKLLTKQEKWVCSSSESSWPSKMLQITYHLDSLFNALIETNSKEPVRCH